MNSQTVTTTALFKV